MQKRLEHSRVINDAGQLASLIPWITSLVSLGIAGGAVMITIGRPRRSKDQNKKLWPMLQDIASQVCWHGQYLKREEWKDVLTAGLKGQKVVPGIDGGFVVVGMSTSRMKKADFCALVEFIYYFGAEHSVTWSEPEKAPEEIWRQAA